MADPRSDVAERYAAAFFELAVEQKELAACEDDLKDISSAISGSDDLQRLVGSPVFDTEAKRAGIEAVLDKIGVASITRNFVSLLAVNGRLSALPAVVDAFMRLAADHRGEVAAEAVSARPLSADQERSLRAQIEAAVGKAVNLKTSVDESLLGGLIVKVGSRMVDSSLRTKLTRLQQTLKEA